MFTASTMLVLVTTLLGLAKASQLEADLLSLEATITATAELAEADYASWLCGGNPVDTTESQCYLDACKSTVENKACSSVNSAKSQAFGQCAAGLAHAVVGFDETVVRFPDAGSVSTKAVQEDLFWTSGVTSHFKQQNNVNAVISWQYISTPNGLYRTYPAHTQDVCYAYDPRLRPWYVAATSGPKDVVIVIDKSGSMDTSGRMELTKAAVESVLTTLTQNDFVAVVMFDDTGKQLCNSVVPCGRLSQATTANKDALNALVQVVTAGGGTDFLSGLNIAFPLFNSDVGEGASSSRCSRAVLFLTDGEDGTQNDNLAADINALNVASSGGDGSGEGDAANKAIVFTYSLGSGAARDIPKQIACDSNGIWSPVTDNGNIRGQMSHFYDFFSSQRSSGDSRVAWVEPYLDASGAGMMTTASKAMYDKSVSPPKLIGVVGVDILMTSIQKSANADGGGDPTALLAALARRSAACVDFNTDNTCTLATLRTADHSDSSSFSALLGGVDEVDETERLCSGDPTDCGDNEPKCTSFSQGVAPKTMSSVCNTQRGSDYEENCAACGYSDPQGDAANSAGSIISFTTNVVVTSACVIILVVGF